MYYISFNCNNNLDSLGWNLTLTSLVPVHFLFVQYVCN
jgi:hypothetical protein